MSTFILASSIVTTLLLPLVLLGAVTDPVIVTIISWASFGVDTISVIYGIW